MHILWMYDVPRPDISYIIEVGKFIEAAKKHNFGRGEKKIWCLCLDCNNQKIWVDPEIMNSHLIMHGFVKNYKVWSCHGESMETTSVETREQGSVTFEQVGDDINPLMTDAAHEDEDDDIGLTLEEMLRYAEPELINVLARGLDNYETLQKASKDLLYEESEGCDMEFTLLRAVLELLKSTTSF
ncbi:hypothetical protein ACP70R_003496 [Stipagrostis hirtigluma subsp. patula]